MAREGLILLLFDEELLDLCRILKEERKPVHLSSSVSISERKSGRFRKVAEG